MSDKLQALFDRFATEARAVLLEEAHLALARAAGGGGQPDPLSKPTRGKPGPKPKGATPKVAKRGKWQKRTAEELEALSKSVIAAVRKEPGLRSEHLAAKLETTTKDLALPLGALVTAGTLKTKGQRRGTQYFPGKG